MKSKNLKYLVGVLALGLVVIGVSAGGFGGGYQVSVVLDSATSVVAGAPVKVNGFKAGEIKSIKVEDGKAKVTFSLDDDYAPLHDGATAVIGWKATLSERNLEIVDGKGSGAEIPDGGMLRGQSVAPVEIADLLAALDAPTRAKLQGTFTQLAATLKGAEPDANATLKSAGAAVGELSSVLRAVGTDGPAIKALVVRLNKLMTAIAARDSDVQAMVTELNNVTSSVATRRTQLRETLKALPGTLQQADTTLGEIPATVDAVMPLLEDLKPATSRLRPTAQQLKPLLSDLQPMTAELRPALSSLSSLLSLTPRLLNQSHSVLPQTQTLLNSAKKPVAFLRPYTPEVMGFFSTWASAFANYDSNGNFARILGQAGLASFNENPGVMPPGITYDPYPKPGEIVGQAWTDAEGSDIR